MNCPKCGNGMTEGKTFIGDYGTGWLGSGGMCNLTFKAPDWHKHVMQECSDVRRAHYCDHCGAVLIETTRRGLSSLE